MTTLRKVCFGVLVVMMLLASLLPLASQLDVSTAEKAEGHRNLPTSSTEKSNVKAVTYTEGNGTPINVAEVNSHREESRAAAIAALANTGVFDNSFVQALTDLYSAYDEDLYLWLANLYDPEVGGFYYSNSARDNVGFLPDLESTAQALELLDKSGLDGVYNDVIGETLSDETRLQLYLFALSLYNSGDGYYYHPQWGTSVSSSRKGRDKGWGNRILNAFDPNTDGDSNVYTYSNSSDIVLTARLGLAKASTASKIVSASFSRSASSVMTTSSAPAFSYASWEELKAYVDYWVFTKKDSYTMGNTINANVTAIANAGLRDDLTEYLAEIQYDNGLWEEETTYNAINGLMKLCGIFGGNYISFPKATEAVESLLSILIGEIDDDGSLSAEGLSETKTIVYIYNPWVAMYKLVGAVNNEGNKAQIAALLKDYAPELMGNVAEKLKAFNRDDGGFSYFQNKTADKAQGSPVAIAGTCESDVNSTGVAISTLRYVLRVYQLYCDYDFDIPALYFEADREYFLSVLESRTAVEKVVKVEHPESVTFDDTSYVDESVVDETAAENGVIGNGGVLLHPYTSVFNNVNDNTADEGGNFKWFTSSIVDSPTDATNKVLYAATYIDADGTCASSASNTQFDIVNSGVQGNTYVFEADLYLDSSSLTAGTSKCVAQILIGNKYTSLYDGSIDVYATKASDGSAVIYLQESNYYLGSEAVRTKLAEGISADEWFNLRIELTKNYGENGSLENMLINLYVDGTLKSENVNTGRYSSSSGYYNYDINCVRISYYRSTPTRMYLDNVYAAKVSAQGSVSDYYPGSTFDYYGVDPDEKRESLNGTYDIGRYNLTFFRDDNEGYLLEVSNGIVTLYYTYNVIENADATLTISPAYYSRSGESGTDKAECFAAISYTATPGTDGWELSVAGDDDHLCELCGEKITDCVDEDRNAICDVCGNAAVSAYVETGDCFLGSDVLFVTEHASEGLGVSPVYTGSDYVLDFWCVYSLSGDTVSLVATFDAGASYTINSSGLYRITPVFVANNLNGVSENEYNADLSTTNKITTSDDCISSSFADAALSGKWNVYSGSSTAPLKTSNVSQLYITADPTDAANTVLAWMSSGTSGTGYGNAVLTLNLDNTSAGNVYIVEFDYYLDYSYYSGASLYTAIGVTDAGATSYELARINHGGAAMANYSLNPDNVVTPGSATSYFSISTRTSLGAASGEKFTYDSDTWYNVKLVVYNNTVYTFVSQRGTEEYTLLDVQAFAGINSAGLSTLTLSAGIYKNRSVILYDNLAFYSTNIAPCIDSNNDCLCDICGESTCADNNGDHNCDLCDAVLSTCADGDSDHNCDLCGAVLSTCADNNSDHDCDLCGAVLTTCADNDSDHDCDLCGAVLSTCADNDSDHDCDLCGAVLSTCADNDSDHDCDLCGAVLTTCADNDSDHNCDVCGTALSSFADADGNLICDICGEAGAAVYLQSADCAFAGGAVSLIGHADGSLAVAPVYSGSTYLLDFWCVYNISGDTSTLISTFDAGESYAVTAAGEYRITPVFVANTLSGISQNGYNADLSSTDKIATSDNCLTVAFADAALSGKWNVYSGSSTPPLKTSNVSQLYITADPTNAANTVLSWMSSGTSGTGYGNASLTINVDSTVSGSVYMIEFDYYLDYSYFSGASLYTAIGVSSASTAYELARLNHGGAAMANAVPDNTVYGQNTSYFTLSTRTSAGGASGKVEAYLSDSWYSVMIAIANDTVYIYIAQRGSDNYALLDAQPFSGINSAGLTSLTLSAGIYKNRSVILYDNISFYTSNSAPCIDIDSDHNCDICDEVLTVCTDDNSDCLCDVCGVGMCADNDSDHDCDVCGAVLSTCADNDSNHDCDLCGAVLTTCADNDSDHDCDLCGAVLSTCADNDSDHDCDLCGAVLSTCADNDSDHDCDLCGAVLTTCADNDSDHDCDICGAVLSTCADNDSNHDCDLCGAVLTTCADNDSDHDCDLCGAVLSTCADNDSDHDCDVCGAVLSTCADNDSDHDCDLCGAVLTTCADNDSDHDCDLCGAVLTACADNDSDHDCDLCGVVLTSCTDNNKNAICDICGDAAVTSYLESIDCSFTGGEVIATVHSGESVTVTPVYNGNTYTLDFWCIYEISGSTVTLIATFDSGASYTVSEAGIYRITPVFLATTLAGVTENTFIADTTTTDKTTSDNCLTEEWANAALSGKFNVYSSSSTAPLKTSNVTQLYVVADPSNAANNVLAWMTSGTSGTGYGNAVVSFNLDNTVSGNSYVIEFDYYVDYTYFSGASLYTAIGVSGASNSYELARINHGGAAMANYSLNPDNVVTPGSATSYFTLSTRTSSGAASGIKTAYDTDTWYSVRIVIENDTVNTYLALRGSGEYTLIDSQTFTGLDAAGLNTLTFTAGIYKNRSVIYYDNISFYTA